MEYSVNFIALWKFKGDAPEDALKNQQLRILSVTWNMHGKGSKPDEIENLLQTKEITHHIIAVGTEECLRSIGMSMLISSKKKWINAIKQKFNLNHQKNYSS